MPEDLTPKKLHYLPHHTVIHQNKETTKIRIVYNAPKKAEAHPLNDCVHTGPNFFQEIFDILLRFRSH